MKHLFNISVYHGQDEISHVCSMVGSEGIGIDGLELLTGYTPSDPSLSRYAESVHLPFAIDWYGPATGTRSITGNLEGDNLRYRHYGVDRKDIVESIRLAIRCAEPVDPTYGVFHAGSANINEILSATYSDSDELVVSKMIDILNEVMSDFPDNEPPFTLALENTWWPGMRLLDGSLHDMLESGLEFSDWGICLDTGHILFSSKRSNSEESALEVLNECADSYPDEFYDRLIAMHLHVNTTANIIDPSSDPDGGMLDVESRILKASNRISSIDQHRPFTSPAVKDYVDRMVPEFLVHEIISNSVQEQIRDHICQASFFL